MAHVKSRRKQENTHCKLYNHCITVACETRRIHVARQTDTQSRTQHNTAPLSSSSTSSSSSRTQYQTHVSAILSSHAQNIYLVFKYSTKNGQTTWLRRPFNEPRTTSDQVQHTALQPVSMRHGTVVTFSFITDLSTITHSILLTTLQPFNSLFPGQPG